MTQKSEHGPEKNDGGVRGQNRADYQTPLRLHERFHVFSKKLG